MNIKIHKIGTKIELIPPNSRYRETSSVRATNRSVATALNILTV